MRAVKDDRAAIRPADQQPSHSGCPVREAPAADGARRSFAPSVVQVHVIRRRRRWILPLGAAACYLLFCIAVHLRFVDALDLAVRRAARPGDVWGPIQIHAAKVVQALQPPRLAAGLLLIVGGLSLIRRSKRPIVAAASVGMPVVIVTVGTKWAMERWDPDIFPVGHGGFPSGHTVTAVVTVGVIVLLLRPHTRWGWIVPILIGWLVGGALILAEIHPATDVIGAGLLAATALTTASAANLGEWASYSKKASNSEASGSDRN